MTTFRVKQAADLLGVSDDTVRRWIEAGRLSAAADAAGRQVLDGRSLAALAEELAKDPADRGAPAITGQSSARNQLTGLVTRVLRDTVMAQVDVQCGPFRIVSLMSREAADELGLEPGVLAVASIKSTNVVIGVPHA